MKNISLIAIALLTVFITGCDENGNQTIVGTGDVESMEVDLPAFEGVNVIGTCNVDIQISGAGNVWYRGNPTVTTNVSGVGNINPAES